ncbi:shikimate dehydrogenase [Verrucomicrobiota bacterium]
MMKFAVLGHPIKHSLSPAMHTASFNSIGFAGSYEKLDVPPETLMERLAQMGDEGFGGVNLTIPLKEVAFQNMEQLDESARLLGAVNTVKFTDDGMTGYCTDGYGLLKAVEEAFGETVAGKSIFFIGSGGAGRAAALSAAQAGAKSITLSARTEKRVLPLAKEINELNADIKVNIALTDDEKVSDCKACDLVINASPIGMHEDDESPLPPEAFREGQMVYDMIYMYPETAVMKAAAQSGARTANGIGMLVHQGAKAFEIWSGLRANVEAMKNAVETAVYK